MTSPQTEAQAGGTPSQQGFWRRTLAREGPYLAMLILALIGIGYTDVAPTRSAWYWQMLAIVFAVLCITTQWSSEAVKRVGRMRLIWTQILHWGAFLAAMRLAFLPAVTENMTSEVSGLVLLYALALSTFLAGVYLHWKLAVVGVFLAAGMVAIAYLDQATLLMLLLSVMVIAGFLLWDRLPLRKGTPKT